MYLCELLIWIYNDVAIDKLDLDEDEDDDVPQPPNNTMEDVNPNESNMESLH